MDRGETHNGLSYAIGDEFKSSSCNFLRHFTIYEITVS